ncbi:DUF5690 family protein [Owenweeksia hongkongensis]|uniref:DUF5690 family protein n=1 Tax=Owenweeksia hongkongensis TaxID=253245 RepID=UPI003A917A5C
MIQKYLNRSSILFTSWASLAAFSTYFAMYAFRKPFSAGTFDGLEFYGIDYKIVLIIAQVLGYMLSKFSGIKLVSELKPSHRVSFLLILIGIAQLALLIFAITPFPYSFIWLFLNGLPLGMIWGIVFSFLEGRKFTELLGAGLSVSFIVSSGVVKNTGRWLIMDFGVSDFWMPFYTGLLYLPLLLTGAWMLSKIPAPTADDVALRSVRKPMDRKQRLAFFKKHALGLSVLIFIYMAMTAYRDFRDNFAVEIWQGLGYASQPELLSLTEIPIAIITLVITASLVVVKNNTKALRINFIAILFGGVIAGVSTWLLQLQLISPILWMTGIGFGLYLGYTMFNTMLFDRLIATIKESANVGFLIYLADSFGYMGSVGLLLYKNFGAPSINWLSFTVGLSYAFSIITILSASFCLLYFKNKTSRKVEELQGKMVLS